MRLFLRAFCLVVLAAAACGQEGPAPAQEETQMPAVDPDLDQALIAVRPYGFHVPPTYDGAPAPLVLALHGLGDSGLNYATAAGFFSLADAAGFLLAYPDGLNHAWNASCCGNLTLTTDDVRYLRAVIADMKARYAVDDRRVFVQGHSNGGFMAYQLACQAADRVAAIAPLAGTVFAPETGACQPSEPVAVLHTHGTADATVYYNGGTFFLGYSTIAYLGAVDVVEMWKELNDCGPGVVTDSFDAESWLAGQDTDIVRYADCPSSVELWTIQGGGHLPSLTAAYREAVVDFFLAHAK